MSWSPPADWDDPELMSATKFNAQVRDNQGALKDPPSASYSADEDTNYTTVSSTYEAIDADNLSFELETGGGDIFVGFHGTFASAAFSPVVYLDVEVDGSRTAGDDGIVGDELSTSMSSLSFFRLIPDLLPGEHTFVLQWKIAGVQTVILYAGAGTAGRDVHPQFWVREMS